MEKSMEKLAALNNSRVSAIVDEYVRLCKPKSVVVVDDSPEDAQLLRDKALETGEEHVLPMRGHTYHFDGPQDQARDKAHTKLLISKPIDFGFETATLDRKTGVDEIMGLLDGIMAGKDM